MRQSFPITLLFATTDHLFALANIYLQVAGIYLQVKKFICNCPPNLQF